MMPMPPSCAIAIARRASVTVSIAAETSGILSSSARVRRVFSEASRGRMREWAGRRRTSSKVSAFWITRMDCSLAKQHYTRAVISHGEQPFPPDERSFAREAVRKNGRQCHPLQGWSVEPHMKRILVMLVALAFSGVASAQLYKWVDKNGRVQY